MNNKNEIKAMLAKAEDKLDTAVLNYENNKYDDAVSRSYYAVFHAISAALFSKDLHFSSHSQVIGQFNKEFVKTEIFPKETTVMIQRLFDERQMGDYDFDSSIDQDGADENIKNAEKIIIMIKKYLEIE